MTRFLQRLRLSCLRPLMVWVLVLALPAHGVSNVLLQVTGAAHRHSEVALDTNSPTATPWTARRALRSLVSSVAGPGALQLIDAMHARDHAWQRAADLKAHPFSRHSEATLAHQAREEARRQAHQHAHDTFQRHIHDPHDSSVVALGDHTQAPDAAGGASALDAGGALPLAPVLSVQATTPADSTAAWRRTASNAWHSQVIAPLERPPQA